MRTKNKRLISLLLTLAMVLGLMSGLTVTAYAGGTVYSPASTYTGFDALMSGTDTVTITEVPEKEWYVVGYDSKAGTVTLLAKQSFGDQKFNSNQSSGNSYAGSELESFVLGLIGNNQPLYGIKGALANISVAGDPSISGAVPYLLSSSGNEIGYRLLQQIKWDTDWWTRSPSSMYIEKAYYVNSGSKFLDTQAVDNVLSVRPAIQLDLSKLTFNSANNTFSLKPLAPVTYLKWKDSEKSFSEKTTRAYTEVTGSSNPVTWENEGLYVVNSDVTISNQITVKGEVDLILCDGATLTASNGIEVVAGNTLNIYPGSTGSAVSGTGELIATGDDECAGIGGGGGPQICDGGIITIHGGNITASGGSNAAGIGGGNNGSCGAVTIYGGTVAAIGYPADGVNYGCAGIGGGGAGNGGTVAIYAGTVTTIGGGAGGVGIGMAQDGSSNGNLILGAGLLMLVSNDNSTWTDYDGTNRSQYMKTGKLHTHNFTSYSASGDTITAVCNADDCPLPEVSGNHTATLTIAAPTEGGGAATLTGAGDFAGVTVSAIEYSSDNGSSWTNNVPAGNGFYQARVTVAESYIASVSYGVNAIHKAATENGSFSVPTIAAVNADITIETSPDTGYELESLSVTAEGDETLGVTINGNNGSFNMPEENVTVSAIFKKIDYTVTVANDISNGEVAVDKIAANYRDKVTLTVTPAAGYALNTISVTDATGQAITLSNGSFTMPASNVTVAANFGALKTYTIFYRASGNPSSVQFRTTDSGEGHNMINSAKLGNIDCWAIQVQAAEGKSKFPVAFSTDGGSTWGSLSDRNVVNDIPNDLAEGDAVVIPGEAKAFIVSFLWGDIEEAEDGSYQAEVGKSKNYLATTNTTSITIADPSKEGYSFLGWDNGKTLIEHPNGTVDISGTTESSIYAARWKQNTSTVKFNLNGGSGSISDATVTYGNKVNAPANPTKDGYSFVRWVVARSVSEKINGKETRLSAGTAFNFSDTEIINDLELKAEWKHVHSYVYLQLSDPVFGGAFNDMLEYAPYVHVKLCTSMDDYCSEAHKFDSNGRCVCGATKPTPTVTLQKTIDNAVESTTQVIKNSVVSISAPQTKNSKQFTKWQYYNGSSWVDLSKNTYTAFVIPTDLEVKAVYSGNAAELSVESFNYKGNIAFYFSYKVPNGYTVVDGGILYGNNAHIRYMDAKQLVANVSGMADIMFPYIPSVEMPVHYDPAKDNAAAKFGAQTIANRMFAEQAVNVSGKSTPLFKKLPSFGKSGSTAIAINSSGSNIYYYGMGYVICKAPNGQYAVFMTDAIAATKANPNASTTKTINVQ